MDVPTGFRPRRIYFFTSSKQGTATATVHHTWSSEELCLPVHPMNAVPESLPLLEPAFAHYVAQWEKYMVPDVDDTDACGFWIPPDGMPAHIAPPAKWDDLSEIGCRHATEALTRFFDYRRTTVVWRLDPTSIVHGNLDHVVVTPDELGIDLWRG